jgi:hypothetical protein
MRLGIDLDNTIIRYDELFADLAVERGLLPIRPAGGKWAVRQAVRASAGGEAAWQALQAAVYGREMHRARLFDGVADFLRRTRAAGIRVKIISHKTRTAAADPDGVDLHVAARDFLAANGFFDPAVLGMAPEDVHFAPTRGDKLQAIEQAGCTHFIDDLCEVLGHPAFPREVARYLFTPTGACMPGPYKTCRSWTELSHELLAAA